MKSTATRYHDELVEHLDRHVAEIGRRDFDLTQAQINLAAEAPLKEQLAAERAAETDRHAAEEAKTGGELIVRFYRDEPALAGTVCPECHGARKLGRRDVMPVDCPRCKGSGVIPTFEFGIRSEKVSRGRNAFEAEEANRGREPAVRLAEEALRQMAKEREEKA